MLDNSITLKFVRVRPAYSHSIPFAAALDAALALGVTPAEREKDVNAGFPDPVIVRLERMSKKETHFLSGEVIRKQTSNIPPEAHKGGLTPIKLSDSGGLGLSCAFRFHLPTQILLIQSNNRVVSLSRLNLYLKVASANAEYMFESVARADAWARFNSGVPRRLLMKIASPKGLAGLDNESETIGSGIGDIGEALHGAYVTIDVSMGRKRGSLAVAAMKRVIDGFAALAKREPKRVRVLSASIADQDSHDDVIDFLQEHLVVRDRLELPDDDPDENYNRREAFIRDSFNAHLQHLTTTYGPQKDHDDN